MMQQHMHIHSYIIVDTRHIRVHECKILQTQYPVVGRGLNMGLGLLSKQTRLGPSTGVDHTTWWPAARSPSLLDQTARLPMISIE